MKRFLTLLLASSAIAATWDGTKGTITISTTSDGQTTVVSVSTIDPTVTQFQVSLRCACLTLKPVIVNRIFGGKIPARPSLAVFSIPESEVTGVTVIAMKPADTQFFTGEQSNQGN